MIFHFNDESASVDKLHIFGYYLGTRHEERVIASDLGLTKPVSLGVLGLVIYLSC